MTKSRSGLRVVRGRLSGHRRGAPLHPGAGPVTRRAGTSARRVTGPAAVHGRGRRRRRHVPPDRGPGAAAVLRPHVSGEPLGRRSRRTPRCDPTFACATRAGLRPTHTPAVLIARGRIDRQPGKIACLAPLDEHRKAFRLLIAVLAIADGRRRERYCSGGCSH
ncbi:DUF5958 family protein [Streptomyces sp. NPDC004292]